MEQKYIIITENGGSKWKDDTGEVYHFPTKYINLITEGTKVIYYKGVCKNKQYKDERLTEKPHYFGIAEIGKIEKDSNSKGKQPDYFAKIIDYIPFNAPVFIKNENGAYFESDANNLRYNYWRDGVRKINKEIYIKILDCSNLKINNEEVEINENDYPSLNEVNASVPEYDVFRPSNKRTSSNNNNGGSKRYSKNSQKIGDRGEEIVLRYLRENSELTESEKVSIEYLAKMKITPGYDIRYINSLNKEVGIEVKATTSKYMSEFIITAHEWKAAQELGENYHIYIVVDCLSKDPKIQIIKNPYKDDSLNLEEHSYSISKK